MDLVEQAHTKMYTDGRSGRDPPNQTSASGAASSAPAAIVASIAPTPLHSANALLREANEARERRARVSGGSAGAAEPGPSRSDGGGVTTLSDLPPSEASERCAICEGESVPGINELVRCRFGDGCCIQELGESTAQRACWHVACAPELKAPRPQHVACARHEADARFHLHVNLTRDRQQKYVVLPLASYKDGEFDSASNGAEVEHVDPPPPIRSLRTMVDATPILGDWPLPLDHPPPNHSRLASVDSHLPLPSELPPRQSSRRMPSVPQRVR